MIQPLPEPNTPDDGVYSYELTKGPEETVLENRKHSHNNGVDEILYELFSPDGMHFCHYSSDAPVKQMKIRNKTPFVQINFNIFGTTSLRVAEQENSFASLSDHEYNIVFLPAQTSLIKWETQKRNEVFSLNVLPEIFDRYLPDTHPHAERFRSISGMEHPSLLSNVNLPITPAIKSILYEILNCPLNNHYKRLYLKAKSVELLMLLFNHMEEYSETLEISSELRDIDISRMQQAREILHLNIQNPCSLIDLAHQVGTNENYLKKHFKKVFGHTVYGYVQELRMQQSKQMLLKGDCDLHDVATMAGYKHTHHFISAFKKYFGYAPVKLRTLIPAFWIDLDMSLLCDFAYIV